MGATVSQLIACAWDRHRRQKESMVQHKKAPTTETKEMPKRKETEMASVTTQEVDTDMDSMKHAPAKSSAPEGMARILALTPIQTIVLNPQLELVEISRAYLQHTDLKREACIGKSVYEFASATRSGVDRQTIVRAIEQAVREKEVVRLDSYKDASGDMYRARISPIYDEEEKELLFVVADREIVPRAMTAKDKSEESYTNETYRILVTNVKDYAIFLIDTQGYITTWNAGAQILKQYKPEEIIGKHFSQFYGTEDNANGKPKRELEIAMREGKVEDEGWRYKKDGTRFWASVTIAPVYREGVHIGFSKVTRDLTERKASETRLIHAFEEASKLKSDFLANMSHEIRTPMHGMLTACSLLMDTPLSSEQRELAHIIRESGAILLQVINDILDYSKLASGSFTVNSTSISIKDITSALVKASQPMLKPGVTLSKRLDERVPKNVHSDPLRYRQVLGNLVGNAMKFTEQGTITIVTTMTEQNDDECTLLTEVIDTGIGVPTHAVDALFTPFAQFDSSATKRYKGTGLGLSICKSLVELMGGTIGYRPNEDGEGVGSVFWFTTKLTKITAKMKALMTPPLPEAPGEIVNEAIMTKQLLVVEDNLINRTIMVKLLKNYGFRHIDVALNGEEAITLIKRKPLTYGLILMDINMPVLDGIGATKEIRRMGLDVPIIAMTANALKGDEERYLEIGMNDYIAKPVDRKVALRTLLKWLQTGEDAKVVRQIIPPTTLESDA